VRAGVISGPIAFAVQPAAEQAAKSQSMESRVQEALAVFPAAGDAVSAAERMEHLAILKRWFYRGSRAGEIFFADPRGALPMRRVVRGIGRVYHGEQPETAAPAAPHQILPMEDPS
jgi:hypothetical protein